MPGGDKSRARIHRPEPIDVKAIREKTGMSQQRFCAAFGISLGALRHWEQGLRVPRGTARVLLKIVDNNPKAVINVINGVIAASPVAFRHGTESFHPAQFIIEPAFRITSGDSVQSLLLNQRQEFERCPGGLLLSALPLAHHSLGNIKVYRKNCLAQV